MDRDYDVILADILISIDQIESKIEKADKRMDLTIRRLVKIESRMEKAESIINGVRDHVERFTKDQAAVNLDIQKKLSEIVSKLS
jgi:ribosomal protein L31E